MSIYRRLNPRLLVQAGLGLGAYYIGLICLIYISNSFERPKSTRRLTFSSFFGELFFSCFLNLQSEMMIDADLYPLSYNLELISIFPLTEDTG